VILSSLESRDCSVWRRPESTGICRRTSSAHTALADATKATGEVMVYIANEEDGRNYKKN
jgi:hypothetical protein